MDQELCLGCFSDSVDAEHVIKMCVRGDYSPRCCVEIFDEPQDSLWLVAWIDD